MDRRDSVVTQEKCTKANMDSVVTQEKWKIATNITPEKYEQECVMKKGLVLKFTMVS